MSFVEFLLEYYVYIVIILILLIVTVIGFIVDSKNKESKNSNKSNSNDLEVNQVNANSNVIEQKQEGLVENTSLDVNGGVSVNNSSIDNSLNMGQEVSFQSINVLNGVSDSINNEQVVNTPISSEQQMIDNNVSSTNAEVQGMLQVNDGQLISQNLQSNLIDDNANVVMQNANQVVDVQNVSNSDLNQGVQPIGYVNNLNNLQTNYQMPNYNNQVSNIQRGMEYYGGVMQQGNNNYSAPNVNYNIPNNQVMPNMNFNQNGIGGNSQVANQQQGSYSQVGVTGINVSPVEMPKPMSIDTLNGVSNQNLGVSVSSPLNNSGGVNGQNTSLSNANNIDNNFVMKNNNQSGNNINNSNIVFTTNGSQPFDVTSMFFNNNQ